MSLFSAALVAASLVAGPGPAAFDFTASMETFIENLPRQDCRGTPPYESGREAADDHAKGWGWLGGSMIFPPAGLMALGTSGSDPRASTLVGVPAPDRPCFTEGYRAESASNKRQKAFTGALIGTAAWAAFAVAFLRTATEVIESIPEH